MVSHGFLQMGEEVRLTVRERRCMPVEESCAGGTKKPSATEFRPKPIFGGMNISSATGVANCSGTARIGNGSSGNCRHCKFDSGEDKFLSHVHVGQKFVHQDLHVANFLSHVGQDGTAEDLLESVF
jgi:hypothetical protein